MTQTNPEIEQLFLWNNPDFNEVVVFYGLEAISFRDRNRAKKLSDNLRKQLSRIQCNNWPYKKPLMIAIEIYGPTKKYSRRDLDNMSKVILDSCNKIIYDDDRLVNLLIVQKCIWEMPLYGFHLGIRAVDNETRDKYSPGVCFSSKTKPDIDESKVIKPFFFSFENEADREYMRQNSVQNSHLYKPG